MGQEPYHQAGTHEAQAPSTAAMHEAVRSPYRGWNLAERIGFRFLFLYLGLYLILRRIEADLELPMAFGLAPGAGIVMSAYAKGWAPVVVWTAKYILHLTRPIAYAPGGNSDGLYGYAQLFSIAMLAAIAGLLWALVDRRSTHHRRLHELLRVCLRYALAFSMLSYGMVKVFPVQFFGLPGLSQLVMPYGNFSSHDVLWNFMGYSKAYTFFAGAVEVLAGLLLFFRRTTTLGALVAVAALFNVGVLDFAYGVPEKLDVIHLFLIAAILLAPDVGRLANLLVFNQPVEHASLGASVTTKWLRIGKAVAKSALIAYMVIAATFCALKIPSFYGPRSPLYGIYEVEEFSRNGEVLAPLTTDTIRWRKVVFGFESDAWLEMMDDSWHYYRTEYDPASKNLTLLTGGEKTKNVFTYSQSDPAHVMLRGAFLSNSLGVKLKRFDESKFELMRSSFQWVNGFP